MLTLREYVDEAKRNINFDQERVDSLAKEYDDTLKFALQSFSCKRSIGLEDEELKRPDLFNSRLSDDDSLNFLETTSIGNKHIGPIITDKDRPVMIKLMEKLGGLWD